MGRKTRAGRGLSAALGRSRTRLVRRPSWSEVQEYRRKLDRAQKNMPARASAQLRWAVAFAQLDLDTLSPAERESLGYDLRVLMPPDWTYRVRVGPLGDEKIRRTHAIFGEIIRFLLGKEGGRWPLPSTSRYFLVREEKDSGKDPRALLYWEGDEAEAIVRGFINLLLSSDSRLRACLDCAVPFIARKRQIYCSSVCSQRTRNWRMQEREESTRGRARRRKGRIKQ